MNRGRSRIAAVFVSVTLWSLALPAQQRDAGTPTAPVTGTGQIAGRVLSAEANSQPMRRALVTLTGTGPTLRSVLTDDSGAFSFTALPPGTFTVTARKAAYLAAPYGARRPGRPGTSIALAAGQRTTIAISMFRGAAISGTLRDASGAPVPGVDVRAIDARVLAAGLDPSTSRDFATSDDRGVFRMYGLMPGEYVLAALPSMPGREISSPSTSELDAILGSLATRSRGGPASIASTPPPSTVATASSVSFAPVFYPGSPDLAAATRVRVGTGEEAANIDFVITAVPVGAIEGVINGPSNLTAIEVTMFQTGPRIANSFNSANLSGRPIDPQGRFRYGNLSPGRYRVVARARRNDPTAPPAGSATPVPAGVAGGGRGIAPPAPAGEYFYAFADVELTGDMIATANLTLQPGATLSGRIVFTGTGGTPKPEDLTRIRPSVSLDGGGWNITADGGLRMGPSLASQSTAVVKPDSTFEIRGIGPGWFTLNCSLPTDASRAWSLRSATLNGRDLLDDLIDMTANGDLRNVTIAFSDTPTVLTGSLQLPTGQTTTDYTIVVLPVDRTLWRPKSRRIVSVRPATDGQFSFSALPAGEYFLAAMTDVDPVDLADPEFLAQIAPAAVKVTVVEGETRTQVLQIR